MGAVQTLIDDATKRLGTAEGLTLAVNPDPNLRPDPNPNPQPFP